MLSALTTAPVSRKSAICSAICSATFSCASVVEAPRCGVADDIVAAEQDVLLGRLDREDVERRARDLAEIERRLQIAPRRSARRARN